MWFQETELQILETVIIFVEVLQNVYTVLTLFFAFPFLIVSEIGLCGKDRKKKSSHFNSFFQSNLNLTVLPPSHFICLAR